MGSKAIGFMVSIALVGVGIALNEPSTAGQCFGLVFAMVGTFLISKL